MPKDVRTDKKLVVSQTNMSKLNVACPSVQALSRQNPYRETVKVFHIKHNISKNTIFSKDPVRDFRNFGAFTRSEWKIRTDFRQDHVPIFKHQISLLLTTVAVIGLFLNTDLFAEGSTVNFFGSLIILHLSSIGHQPYRVAFEYKRHVYSSRKSQSPSQSLPIKQSEKGPAMSSLVSYLIYVHRSTNNSVLFNFRIISSWFASWLWQQPSLDFRSWKQVNFSTRC